MKKRGFVFSLFVITALSLVVLNFKMNEEFKEEERAEIFENRVKQISLFIEDLEEDTERALRSSGYQAFLGINHFITHNKTYIDNTSARVVEIMINNTVRGTRINITNDTTFVNWTKSITNLSKRLGVNLIIKDISLSVKQSDHWTINLSIIANMSIFDLSGVVGWNFTLRKSTSIDLATSNLPDPMYFLESYNNFYNRNGVPPPFTLLNNISRTPFGGFWFNDTTKGPAGYINVTNLSIHTNQQFYREYYFGPSYFMRLEGRIDCANYLQECSDYGIESFVNVSSSQDFTDFSIGGAETCSTDYQFFFADCLPIPFRHAITNMPQTTFLLDDSHVGYYGLTGINST